MKKILLITGISAISFAAFAQNLPEPTKLGAYVQCLSPNGKYAVSSMSTAWLEVINLDNGHIDSFASDSDDDGFYFGIGSCLSDNGILVGGTTMSKAEYCKDGVWYPLDVPGSDGFSNTANAITPDGSRICGMIGVKGIALDGDVLMVVPCIWNAEGDGYGDYVELPHPEYDFAGRIPQYIKAIDISADGKTIIGMITDAVGYVNYPILYQENEEGKWSYTIPHEDLLVPEGLVIPKYPGEFTIPMPSAEQYMTPAELDDYYTALQEYYDSNYTLPYPDYTDYMNAEELDAYEKDMAEYNVHQDAWNEKYDAWAIAYNTVLDYYPSYENNSVRIANDGQTYGCSTAKIDFSGWGPSVADYNTWVFDIDSDNIIKYDQRNDLSLTYLADGGVAVASSSVAMGALDNSYILKDGEVTGMYDWMNSKVPAYASWMKDNMTFEYEMIEYDDNWDPVLVEKEEFATGHAVSTPDLSVIALSVQNVGFIEDESVYDDPDYMPADAYAYIFDLNAGTSVDTVRPAAEGKVIYDLSGRQLKEATAPGIYIINGEKKVVR